MTLPLSGPISIYDIVGEFGGVAPHSLTEYYRGGGWVPASITETVVTYGTFSTWYYEPLSFLGGIPEFACRRNANGTMSMYWDGALVGTHSVYVYGFRTVNGGYEYESGSEQATDLRSIRRRTRSVSNQATPVNTGVPSSGAISIQDFYGGRAN